MDSGKVQSQVRKPSHSVNNKQLTDRLTKADVAISNNINTGEICLTHC